MKYTSHTTFDKLGLRKTIIQVYKLCKLSLEFKRHNTNAYIQFISQFGPALRGIAFWNNNKTTKLVSELLTVTNEAFIHLCIINYSATWKAQEKQKAGETDVEILVSDIY